MWSGHVGWLALFSTYSRHSNIIMFWVSQTYSKIPKPVWEMCDLSFIFYMSPTSEIMFKEKFDKEDIKQYKKFYKTNIINGPQYSFLCIDSNAGHKHQKKVMYQNGDTGKRYFLD